MEFLAGSKQYTLSYLADTQLGIQHTELEPHRMDPFFVSGSAVADLVRRNSYDARLQLKLMFHLDVIPLTKQLTELCGNRWQRTLRSARAERVEYLLLQEFSSQVRTADFYWCCPSCAQSRALAQHLSFPP